MELKNCNAITTEDIAIEVRTNKAVELTDNILLEIMYNSCIEVDPSIGINSANEN